MNEHHVTPIDEVQARQRAAVVANDYGVLRLSPRRWALIRREVHVGRRMVGYGKVERRGGIALGAELSDPQYLVDWVGYHIVEGCESMTEDGALRALYVLTHPKAPVPQGP